MRNARSRCIRKAQPTTENLIGGLNLFVELLVRLATSVNNGDNVGNRRGPSVCARPGYEVPAARSRRFQNTELVKMPIVNFSLRDRLLI